MKLRVALVQMSVARGRYEENLEKGEAFIAEAARGGSELVCFPEMWTTGFDWETNHSIAAEHESAWRAVSGFAGKYGAWVSGSMLSADSRARLFNTHALFSPAGEAVGIYHKTHLFSLIGEDRHLTAGDSLCTVEAPWGMTALAVCYDLRFPELFRSYALRGALMTLLPAAFPFPRLEHWNVLVRARAIEDQMFMVATNQVGSEEFAEGGRSTYFGRSVVIDPWGRTVVEAGESEEAILRAEIDLEGATEARGRMKVLEETRADLYELG